MDLELLELALGGAFENLAELDRGRALVVRDPVVVGQFLFGDLVPLLADDQGDRIPSPLLRRHLDDDGLCRGRIDGALDEVVHR